MANTSKKDKFSYDKSIEEIEKIIERLQTNDNQSLDETISDVDKAILLLKQCKTKLTDVNSHLNKLFDDVE